jgi:hypothetical protein
MNPNTKKRIFDIIDSAIVVAVSAFCIIGFILAIKFVATWLHPQQTATLQETTTEISMPENDKVCVFVDIITYCQLSSYSMFSEPYNFRCFSSKNMSQNQIIQKVFSTVEQMKKDKKKAISEYSERKEMIKTIQEAVNK